MQLACDNVCSVQCHQKTHGRQTNVPTADMFMYAYDDKHVYAPGASAPAGIW